MNSYDKVQSAIASAAAEAAQEFVNGMAAGGRAFNGYNIERALERMSTLHLLAKDPATILVIARVAEDDLTVDGLEVADLPTQVGPARDPLTSNFDGIGDALFGDLREDPDVRPVTTFSWYRWAAGQVTLT